MSHQLPEMGKISAQVFDELIFPHLGAKSNLVLTPPQHGVDVGIIDLGNGKVMALTSDPVFIVPEYGFEKAAWFAIHILVSDAVTSGLKPSFLCIDLNLPLSLSKDDLSTIWLIIDRECKKMGINIISGHTARYQGCNYPMVGGATVICIGDKDRYVTPKMAQIGDKIILTKGAAIEASGIFAVAFKERIRQEFGEEFGQRAEKIFWQMSVVEDALTAASVGTREKGVTSMHDATECGVWGGLYEVAKASNVGMRIEKDEIIISDEVDKICAKFGMDPYSSISEGTLIITCKEQKVEFLVQRLNQKKIPCSVIGEITDDKKGIIVIEKGAEHKLEHPQVDPFWGAFAKALSNNR
ncbi:MAG: AIR synthase family protein [candidate division Zixibacteria bacterium]|nr:AIR synthase family protein [candidate division Zixibacteria bacterium]